MSKTVKVPDGTYTDISDTSNFSKVPMTNLIEMAWENFKTTREYSALKLLGKKIK